MNKNTVFYILPEQTVNFEDLGTAGRVSRTEFISTSFDFETVIETLKRKLPIQYLGKEAKGLTLVCIPARDHAQNQEEPWTPPVPIIIKTQKQTNLKGYISGRRSALLYQQGKLYRYKGCGNDTEGFVIENNQLRGSHFQYTSKRELFMTNLINKILEVEVLEPSANKPLFYFQYPKLNPQLGLRDDLKLLKKYCCVFETQGDRRLGTHLISPLEILFLNIFQHDKINYEALFSKKQRKDQWGLTELLTDFEMSVEKGQKFLEKYDQRPELKNYVNISEVRKDNTFKHADNFHQIIHQIATKFSPLHRQRVEDLLGRNPNWIYAMQTLLERIGWEMGQIKRIFCRYGINWGFFNDHGQWHCNAHLNNFVVKFPTPYSRFILPLDFDLAFTKEEFINIDLESETYGERDDDLFEKLLMMEYNSMEMSVSGVQIMNFRYSIEEQTENKPSLLIKMARIAFRDTLVRAFRWGMRNERSHFFRIHADWQEDITRNQALVEACLHISTNFQT